MAFLLAYLFSAFFKVSANIVMPIYQQKLALSASFVGFLSSMYFVVYAIVQLMTGPLCRKFGPYRVVGLGFAIATLGSVTFAYANSSASILLARMLVALGVGPAFISTITFLTDNYEGPAYAKMIGATFGIYGIGSALSSAPLKSLINNCGITASFLGIAAVILAIGVMMLILGSKNPVNQNASKADFAIHRLLADGFKNIAASPALITIVLSYVVYNMYYQSYQGLWSSSWFTAAHPSFENLSGYSSTALSIGLAIGTMTCERFHKPSTPLHVKTYRSEIVYAVLCLVLIFSHNLNLIGLAMNTKASAIALLALDFLFGLLMGDISVQVSAYARAHTNAKTNPTVMGVMNMLSGIAIMGAQWVVGVMYDSFTKAMSPNGAFNAAYGILAAILAIATVFEVLEHRKG